MILDAGFLISVDRNQRAAQAFLTAAQRQHTSLHTTDPVVAQVWRNGARQGRLAKLLGALTIHPFNDGRDVGDLRSRSRTSDVVDAQLVILALRLSDSILTGDTDDLTALASALPTNRPTIYEWPWPI